jgi:acyl-CoA synthetase (AMP-forming)/AMP-acid ligase II
LDFIEAYFGCLYAKLIAVPAYPPHPARLEKTLPVISGIVADAAPSVTLLNSSLFDVISSRNEISARFGNMKWLVTDQDEFSGFPWRTTEVKGNDIAFLQYTSGSTTTPRGVMVSHSNLLHNLGLIENYFGQSCDSHAVIWLPPYHDMGLVGGILQPLYSGYPATLLPHMMFLQKPFRWLHAISRFKASTSGGPNFAFDLCVRKIKPEQRELLDLSHWEVAFNGAEQVYHKTLQQFADFFSPCGFRREAFLPCYGLAEATLMVTGGPKLRAPVLQHAVRSELEQKKLVLSPFDNDNTVTLVSCGQYRNDQDIRIVDADTKVPCAADQVGEIWVSGASVAQGYWNKPAETADTFGAHLDNNDSRSFLRTGDLGFIRDGELYITGRLKDLIIIDGSNYYPHDIERTVELSHPAIRPAGCAAFSIGSSAGEQLVIVAEIDSRTEVDTDEVTKAIRKAVAECHDLHVGDISLTRPGGIPRTTSGKIRRYLCKANFINGTLKETTPI